MEINNLLTKIRHQQKEPLKQFLAINITEDTVQVAVWQVHSHKTEIVKLGSIEHWSESTESLIKAVDFSLSNAIEGIEQEPNEVVLGLPYSWVKENNIIPEKKDILKKLIN